MQTSAFQEQNSKHITAFKAFLMGDFPIAIHIVNYQTPTEISKCGNHRITLWRK